MTGTHRGALFGAEATGKRITSEGITFDRFRNGKLVESFVQWDTLHFLQELGVAPRMDVSAGMGESGRPQHS